jgi:hypothetical protein
MHMLRRSSIIGAVLFAIVSTPLPATAAEVVAAGPWQLHSSFWMSLHQTLMDEATKKAPEKTAGLTPAELTAWTEAVNAYKAAGGEGDMTFARAMVITSDGLTQVADDAIEAAFDVPMKDALVKAAPIYRAHGWPDDDKGARFFIAAAAGLMRDSAAALIKAHETVYRATWPTVVRAYVTPVAGPFGAYTVMGRSGGVITTMSFRDDGYQGFRAMEMLLHESSHAIVGPNNGVVANAIAAASKSRGIAPPRDLWHALLFATSSEVTKRYLAERGITFVPSSVDLFTRAWPKYREAVEKFWLPYVSGEGTLESAVDKVVGAIQ